jgi:hypothetical protein
MDDFHPQGEFEGLGGKKGIYSLSVGLFQVLSRYSLVGTTIDYIRGDGYLGHPYLPVILESGALIVEHVPDMRNSIAATTTFIQGYRLAERLGSIHLNLGMYEDDWEMTAQTGEIQWFQYILEEFALRLRVRYYRQTPTGFASPSYQGNELYRSADIRYFRFQSLLYGIKFFGSFPASFPAGWPDRWNISYDQGIRDTRGELGTNQPTYHFQLFSASEFYREGTFMAGFGYDW